MNRRKDILLGENGNIVADGDLNIGVSDDQHVAMIVEMHPAELKEFPRVGFGISGHLKKTALFRPKFVRDIKVQLAYDNYSDPEITFDKGNLDITI